MPRYGQIRRTDTRQRLDRDTWADIYELAQEFVLYGRGMYLMEEPCFFGVAYEEAPFMTYSVTRRNGLAESVEVESVVRPSEGLLDSGNHRGSLSNKVVDGSFEMWGQNGGVGVPFLRPTASSIHVLPGEDWTHMYGHWVQFSGSTPGASMWVGANDRAFHGNYSAKTVLGAGQSDSRPLMPMDRWSMQAYTFPVTERHFFSYWGTDGQNFHNPHYNPRGWYNTVTAYVYAEQPCNLRMNASIGGLFEHYVQVPYGAFTQYDEFPFVDTQVTHQIPAGAWTKVQIGYPTPYYEEFCAGNGRDLVSKLTLQVTDGTPGSAIWVDNVYHSGQLTTEANVLITVGVAEWVRDEQDNYIGAKLWFRIGDVIPPQCWTPPPPCVV